MLGVSPGSLSEATIGRPKAFQPVGCSRNKRATLNMKLLNFNELRLD